MIEMKNISKSFGTNRVLDHVNLTLDNGEVLALLGENGAGKSTLMNILGGVLGMDEGELSLDGANVVFNAPIDSLNAGIAFIHQELNLINDLPIFENMFLGNELRHSFGLLDMDEMVERTAAIFKKLEIDLNPRRMVSSLDSSYKQIVEISRALLMDARYIIMDEPTTSLSEVEIKRVFEMMRTLKKQGVGIIFISHKLEEVMDVCDRYTVLRSGEMVAEGSVAETNTHDLALYMVGHEVRSEKLERDVNKGKALLELDRFSNENDFFDISLTLHQGEILGVTGLLGDGRSELFLSLFGDMTNHTGKILLDGQPVTIHSIGDAMKHGIAYVPKNRKENAIIKDMSILENGTLVSYDALSNGLGVIHREHQNQAFDEVSEKLFIKMGDKQDLITSLSGGNQQKVVLLKWLITHPKILILDNPTQGVDVGSKEEIYDIIHALANEGVGIILLSNEANEIIRVCDRTLVLFHGRLQGELIGKSMSEHGIMKLATGAKERVGKS